jgi:hypothetical protein
MFAFRSGFILAQTSGANRADPREPRLVVPNRFRDLVRQPVFRNAILADEVPDYTLAVPYRIKGHSPK